MRRRTATRRPAAAAVFVLAVLSGAAGAPHPAAAFVPSVPDAPRPSAGSRICELPLGHIPPPSGPGAAGPQVPPVPPSLGAPGLSASFEGLDFDAEAALSGFYHIPPDPIGAAGPDHVVSVVNSAIQWQSKTGTGAVGKPLGHDGTTAVGSFFESLSPVTRVFDPKVVYDQHAGRFVVVCLEWTSTTSRILRMAVSGATFSIRLTSLSPHRW